MPKAKDMIKKLNDTVSKVIFKTTRLVVVSEEYSQSNEKKDMIIKQVMETNSVLLVGTMKARKEYLNYSVDNGIVLKDVRVFSESMIQNIRGIDFKDGLIIDDSVTKRSFGILKMLYPKAKINGVLRKAD